MTFESRELSTFDGSPRELYRWTCGAAIWPQTSCDEPIVHMGTLYEPAVLLRTEISQNAETQAGQIKVSTEINNPLVSVYAGRVPNAPVNLRILGRHLSDPDDEFAVVFRGRLANIKLGDFAELTIVPAQDMLKQQLPDIGYQAQCPRIWGTGGCPVSRWDHRVVCVVSNVIGNLVYASALSGYSANYFRSGWIETPVGLGRVISSTTTYITLLQAIPGLIVGMQFDLFPGCLGTEEDCATRWNALNYHLGFSRIPARNPFGSGGI